jgi:hypothetical protein
MAYKVGKTREEMFEQSRMLVESIDSELKLGTKHFNDKGKLLETIQEVVDTLKAGGRIHLEPVPERQHLFASTVINPKNPIPLQ